MTDKIYTQEELDQAVTKAIKFVNECNARQLKIIEQLRLELELKNDPRQVENSREENNRRQPADRPIAGPMDFVPLSSIRNIST